MSFGRPSEIQPARKELKQIWQGIRSANRLCMVPALPGEPPESNRLTDCHIIGESCLEVIAHNRHLYQWPSDPTIVGDSAVKGIKAGRVSALPGDLAKATPFRDNGHSIKKFVWRFACNFHDNKAFKDAEKPDMDLDSNAVQFQLGFRTIAATTAWVECHLSFFGEAFLKRKRTKRILREYPQSRLSIPQFEHQTVRLESLADRLRRNLGKWQDQYSAQPADGYSIVTCRREVRPVIRSAGAGVPSWNGQNAISVTILPRRQDGLTEPLCVVVVTCLSPSFWPAKLYQRWRMNRLAGRMANLLSQNPVANIPYLTNALSFFCVSPEDFDDDSILNDQQRQEIHERIARDRTPDQPQTP